MTSRQVGRVNGQSKGETPLVSGVLQRAAVRAVADKEGEATQEVESGGLRESRFVHDFSQVPIGREGLPPIQAKLTIGEPNDKYEQEADRVASQVVQQINTPASVQSSQGQIYEGTEAPEEEEIQTKQENTSLQRKEASESVEASKNMEYEIRRARGGGQPLETGLQQSMEQAMGAEFRGVRVHTDAQSDQLNQSIQAKAFTTGQDVFFRQGAYEPGRISGQELIAHELTHVEQQKRGARPSSLLRINRGKSDRPKNASTLLAKARWAMKWRPGINYKMWKRGYEAQHLIPWAVGVRYISFEKERLNEEWNGMMLPSGRTNAGAPKYKQTERYIKRPKHIKGGGNHPKYSKEVDTFIKKYLSERKKDKLTITMAKDVARQLRAKTKKHKGYIDTMKL